MRTRRLLLGTILASALIGSSFSGVLAETPPHRNGRREAHRPLGPVLGLALPQHRPVPRRPLDGGHRRPASARHVLLRRHRRRRLEDDRRRIELGGRVRQGLQDRIGRRDRRLGIGPERRLRRDGRVVRSAATSRTATASTSRPTAGAAGRTWGSRRRARSRAIRIHPTNPDLVYVAAQGHAFGPNAERGVYRSEDGGKSWKKVLFVDDKTGASDLSMDPRNPRVLYAAFWQVVRHPWELVDGGPGSALYRSTDGGDTWKKLTEGLPEEIWGRVGVAASGARSRPRLRHRRGEGQGRRLSAARTVGEKWTHVNDEHKLRERAWYYSWIYPDPKSRRHGSTCRTWTSTSRPTAASRSTTSRSRTATTTTSGSIRTIRRA